MNNTTRYDNLFKRLKTNTSQREAIGTQLSNEKDKLNKMKEDCRLQATLELAKRYAGKKFRYVDLEIESPALPRTVTKITFCE